VQEHLFYPVRNTSQYSGKYGTEVHGAYRSFYSPFELLSFAAALSPRMTLGTSVVVAGYHRPLELAQRVATLDQLSGGRVVLGIGAGWSADEHAQMNVDFATRGNRLDEFLPALVRCWGDDPVEFNGSWFSIPPAEVQPKPFGGRRPALMSGMRSAAGLRRTAEYFDIWNPPDYRSPSISRGCARTNPTGPHPCGSSPGSTLHALPAATTALPTGLTASEQGSTNQPNSEPRRRSSNAASGRRSRANATGNRYPKDLPTSSVTTTDPLLKMVDSARREETRSLQP